MIEIIASSIKDAITIEKGKGERIELVSAFSEGGLTPSLGMVQNVLLAVKIPVFVMLRPIGYSFHYEPHHLEAMRTDARFMEEIGVKHVVVGMLDREGLPDLTQLDYVLGGTNLTATFHRAFDSSSDLKKSLEIINRYPKITHLLTSGGPGKAIDNIEMLKYIIKNSRPRVVLGSGITLENVLDIKKQLNIRDNVDIHTGTSLRHGLIDRDVDENLVKEFVELYNK